MVQVKEKTEQSKRREPKQIQVYTTNVIMEFNTTQSFVKSLEGVRDF